MTDEYGRYEMGGLPAGRYIVSVSKVPYASVEYGQRRALVSGSEVALGDGGVVDRIDVALPRGSVIAGRVLDDFGEPAAYVSVTALRPRYSEGKRALQPVGRSAMTDDIGQYRIAGLLPGSYYVRTTPSPTDEAFNLAPSYYSSTQDPASAEPVTVGLASEVAGVDFSILPGGLARVRGIVVDDRGQPARGARVALVSAMSGSAGGGGVRPDGTFVLPNVAPGEYSLAATRTNPATGEMEVVQKPLSVAGTDVDGLTISLGSGGSLTGMILTDDGSIPEIAPASVRVRSTPLPGSLPIRLASSRSGVVGPDWTFSLTGIGGAFLLRLQPLPSGWMLKQVLWRGEDVSDVGFSIAATDEIGDVQLVISRRTTEIAGTVFDNGNRPVSDSSVIAFAEDRSRWRPYSRHFAAVRPDQQGRFAIKNLPPGDYFLAAVDYVEDGTEEDPDLLESLRPSAIRVALGEGEHRTLSLPLTTPRR